MPGQLITVRERQPLIVAGGRMVQIDHDVLDIARRIVVGDESGWPGDPNMRLTYNQVSGQYEVIGIDARGIEYIAASSDTCDHTLILKLVAGRPQNDPIGKILAHNEKLRSDQEKARNEHVRAVAEKAVWAMRRDLAQHFGGKSTQYAVSDGRKRAS